MGALGAAGPAGTGQVAGLWHFTGLLTDWENEHGEIPGL